MERLTLKVDTISGPWRLELARGLVRYGVLILVVGRVRFWLQWPVPAIS
jgi:hypothetical protein